MQNANDSGNGSSPNNAMQADEQAAAEDAGVASNAASAHMSEQLADGFVMINNQVNQVISGAENYPEDQF